MAMAVLAEATRLATNAGIDAGRLPEALAGDFADSTRCNYSSRAWCKASTRHARPHLDDVENLDTVTDAARTTSTPVPMASLAAQLFRLAKSVRGAEADALEIYKLSALKEG